jgi:hypothetical protein
MGNRDIDILFELDKGEERRKADYTIWGYLYQFDLMLYDMLNQNTTEDMFGDRTNDVDAEYEVEMVEDYAKCFMIDQKHFIRIAQIKYHSQSNEFKDKQAVILLYYAYLKYLSLNINDSNFKCALYYYNKKKEEWSTERIREFLKNSIEEFMSNEAEEETAAAQQDKTKKETKKDLDALSARVKKIIEQSSSVEKIDAFAKNVSVVKWTEERQQLIEIIKEKLIQKHPNDFNNYSGNRGDILYSLYIDFIINTWQRKKTRNDRRKIRLSDIENKIKQLINYEEETFYQSILGNMRYIILEILKLIQDNLLYDLNEVEVVPILKKYKLISLIIYENIRKNFREKRLRFSFINTVTQHDFCEYKIYEAYRVEKEYEIFLINNSQISNFVNRAMKFMYYYMNNNSNYTINFNDWFSITEEFWLFKNPYEKRNIILFPKPYNYAFTSHNRILSRIHKSKIRPEIWYFGSVKSNGIYDLEIPKPKESKQVQVDKPSGNKRYRIGCMDCLIEDEPINFKNIELIYKDRCVEDDAGENSGDAT